MILGYGRSGDIVPFNLQQAVSIYHRGRDIQVDFANQRMIWLHLASEIPKEEVAEFLDFITQPLPGVFNSQAALLEAFIEWREVNSGV